MEEPHGDEVPPRVFVSYTHDTPEHKANVKAFCTVLDQCGIDVRLDQSDTDRRRDWYPWAIDNITAADFVVVVASPVYRLVGDGRVPSEQNRGGQSEASLLRELLHSDRVAWLPRLLPVLFPGFGPEDIPLFLQPRTADHYEIREFTRAGVEGLLRHLLGRPAGGSSATEQPAASTSAKPRPVPAGGARGVSGTGSVWQSGTGPAVANTGTVGGDITIRTD